MKPLVSALDMGYRYRPYEMLRYFLSGLRTLWGLPELDTVPEDASDAVVAGIEAYSELVSRSVPFEDILGPMYMELASHGSRQGLAQFFTPFPVASMMARMSMGDLEAHDGGLIRVCDPACGSGVMLLAFLNAAWTDYGPSMLQRISVTGVDLDVICAHMTAVQLIANCNVHSLKLGELLVLRGNSLMPWEGMQVVAHGTATADIVVAPPLSPERLAALAEAAAVTPGLV
ncbi:N-6 DNA methylase [Novimethylophilus kurashikiensis]|nr:N-6 DNA methylase [Novimethylophilus kurashikiensis]